MNESEESVVVRYSCQGCGAELDSDAVCASCGPDVPRAISVTVPPISVSEPLRSDGYQPLALGLMLWRGIVGAPRDDAFWFMASAARKTDAAQRQLERAREAIDAYQGDPADALRVLSDVEGALVAMHRAVEMAASVNGRYQTSVTFPASVERRREAIKRLRDAYEHVDDRALGIIEGRIADRSEAHTLFTDGGYGQALIHRREVEYRTWRLGIDAEATDALIATRNFLREASLEIFARHHSAL